QAVGPAVVAAAQRLRGEAVALRDRSGAMAADVVERADFTIAAAHRDHRQPGAIDDDVITGTLQLADVCEQLPAAVEDRAAVECRHRRVGIEARGQGGGVVERLCGEVGGVHARSMCRSQGKRTRPACAGPAWTISFSSESSAWAIPC